MFTYVMAAAIFGGLVVSSIFGWIVLIGFIKEHQKLEAEVAEYKTRVDKLADGIVVARRAAESLTAKMGTVDSLLTRLQKDVDVRTWPPIVGSVDKPS